MNHFFKPYEGSRPFLFISYAHLQSEEVVNTIRILHEKGWRLWYDEGIPAGSDWPATIARHMDGCERVLFFLSARAMESPNCYSEMRTAYRMKKPVLIIRLEDVQPDERWTEILRDRPEIPLMESPEKRAEAILRSGFIPRRFHRSGMESVPKGAIGLVASILFFLLSAGALAALKSGLWNPFPSQQTAAAVEGETAEEAESVEEEPPVVVDLGEAERYFAISFPDRDQERAIRSALGIQTGEILRGQLSELDQLYICGNVVAKNLSSVSFDEKGVCRVNGAPVIQGEVSDLRLFPYMVRLEKLGLICQQVSDISGLRSHVLLQELSLAGSPVEDLSTLEDLPSLELLHIEHTGVKDLTVLKDLPRLKTMTVSREMLPLSWDENAGFAVVLVP